MTAREARALSESVTSTKAQTQLTEIEGKIELAARDGKTSTTFSDDLLPNVKLHLENSGFKIDFSGSFGGREEAYHTISW